MYLGIDIGGTTIKYGLYNNVFDLIKKLEVPTLSGIALVDEMILTIQKEFDVKAIKAIGIGVPGFVLENGYILQLVNLDIRDFNIIDYVYLKLEIPVFVLNDANAAAFGETSVLGDSFNSVVMFTLGTGVGAGIVHDNALIVGSTGAAGEIGHVIVDHKYRIQCNCGNKGCLETVASATGIERLYQYYLNQEGLPVEPKSCKDIFDLAKAGDKLAYKVIDIAMDYLGLAIYNTVATLNPDAIIIGGGVAKAKDFLMDIIKSKFDAITIPVFKDTQFFLASLSNDAGIYGLAKYASFRVMFK